MFSRLIKCLTLVTVISMVAGCKLAIVVPSGGDVTSASGTRNCTGGSLCEHDITDTTFNESFTAVAKPGYVFTKWTTGPGFFCSGSINPTCALNNVGFAGNALVEAFIATGQHFYAMPLFDFVGIDTDGDGVKDHVDTDDDNDGVLDVDDACPLHPSPVCGTGTLITGNNVVMVNGKMWAQVDLFRYLNWNAINAVCPAGDCIDGGVLNGYDMTGWTWASVDDVNGLFNFYLGGSVLGPGGASYSEPDSTWAPAFFGSGWRGIPGSDYVAMHGYLSDSLDLGEYGMWGAYARLVNWHQDEVPEPYRYDDSVETGTFDAAWNPGNNLVGGWFFRAH